MSDQSAVPRRVLALGATSAIAEATLRLLAEQHASCLLYTSYAMAMWLNPNNHALDGGRASSRMEWEAVREIAAMFGWREFVGHLTGGGTLANLEALWVAGQMMPGKKIVASEQAHYTHERITAVLRLPFASIACDESGRMDLAHLELSLIHISKSSAVDSS